MTRNREWGTKVINRCIRASLGRPDEKLSVRCLNTSLIISGHCISGDKPQQLFSLPPNNKLQDTEVEPEIAIPLRTLPKGCGMRIKSNVLSNRTQASISFATISKMMSLYHFIIISCTKSAGLPSIYLVEWFFKP